MTSLSPSSQRPLAPNTPSKRFIGFSVSPTAYLIVLFGLVGLFSCQRPPQAYFAPTPYPAAQRAASATLSVRPAETPVLTTDQRESVPLDMKPVWETDAPVLSAVAAAVTVGSRQSVRRQTHRRLVPGKVIAATCDQIVLRSGDVVEAKVKEVGVNEIRYKKCDRPDGPDYTISKSEVLSIKYSNGEVERFNTVSTNSSSSARTTTNSRQSYQSPTNRSDDGPRTDPFAIVAIAAGGLAIFTGLGSLLLGAAAVVFGALSLSRIRKEPNRFKGKGLAMAGMIAGIVAAAAILLYVYVL